MDTSANTSVLFHEEQQFRQPWIWALLLLISAAMLAVAFTHHSFWFALVVLLLDTAIAGFMYSLKLTTEVRQDGIYLRFFPLWVRQTIPFSDIARYEARTYRPILEYGGWGVRYGWKGKAYNVRGNRGVQLELRDGKRLLIGSQRPEELARAIEVGMGGSR
jgi:hypothetical protein